jgi:hypothetical protein
MVVVKIYEWQTPSMSYLVASKLGVPGDSGVWVVDNEQGLPYAFLNQNRFENLCISCHFIHAPGSDESVSSTSLSI